jgi:hypothetical protein
MSIKLNTNKERTMHRLNLPAVRKAFSALLLAVFLSFSMAGYVRAHRPSKLSGVVLDSSGAAVSAASVSLSSSQQVIVGSIKTDSQGRFEFADVPDGRYLLIVGAGGFASHQQAVIVGQDAPGEIQVTLNPGAVNEEVTITANPGLVESTGTITQQVNVISEQQIEQRAKSVTAQIANEEVGVHLQRTAPVMSGIFVRGLTGNKVNIFIDGFRYSTAAMRGASTRFSI